MRIRTQELRIVVDRVPRQEAVAAQQEVPVLLTMVSQVQMSEIDWRLHCVIELHIAIAESKLVLRFETAMVAMVQGLPRRHIRRTYIGVEGVAIPVPRVK